MKKMVFVTAAAIAMAAPATGAAAQSFQGPHVGAQAGWNHDKVGSAPWENFGLDVNRSKDALVGGLYVGYDHLVTPNIVLGLEAGVSAATKDRLERVESGATVTLDPKYSLELSSRAGYLIDPSTLIYARGGYANLRASTRQTGKDGVLQQRSNLNGWMAGAGVERLLTSSVSTRLEYRYSDFNGSGSDVKRHQVLLGASYRF
jgi:outer membrane immunogenic protein